MLGKQPRSSERRTVSVSHRSPTLSRLSSRLRTLMSPSSALTTQRSTASRWSTPSAGRPSWRLLALTTRCAGEAPSPAGLPARLRRSCRGARGMNRLGPSLPHSHLRRPATPHRQTQGLDPCRDRARTGQRTHRIGQHQDPTHHPRGVRLQVTRPRSSPWSCSTSAATAPSSPAGNDPRISQESRFDAAAHATRTRGSDDNGRRAASHRPNRLR